MAIILCFALTACVEDNPNSNIPGKQPTEPVIKYAAEFRGEWINIHNGDKWYINGSTIKVNNTNSSLNYTLARTSENVITAAAGAQKYTLFASRVADASFKAEVKLLDGNSEGTRNVDDGIPPVKVTNPSQPDLPPVIIEPEADGTITVPNQIPGDKIEIVPDSSVWNNIKVELTPGYGEYQDMGVIPLTNGDNFKVTIKLNDTNADINELYADEVARNYIIELENIGKTNSGDIGIEFAWKSSDYDVTGVTAQNFPNIAPGTKKQINVSIASKRIEYYESANRSIKVNLLNYDSVSKQVKRWTDTVSVNFYSEPVSINIKSETQVQGVIKGKRGKSYYFKTTRTGSTGDFTATVEVPWSEDEYRIAFLGADIVEGTATKYSFAVNGEPPSDWQSLNMWDFLDEYKPRNEYEATAPVIDLSQGENSFMGYLAGGSIDYYKVKLGTLVEIRQRTVSFNANGGTGTVEVIAEEYNAVIQLPEQGNLVREGYFFSGWNTDSAGTGTAYAVGANYTITGNVILYAAWNPIYTVTFNANGGTGTVEAITRENGTVIQLPGQGDMERNGYVFSGWNGLYNGTETDFAVGANYTVSNNVTLYAVWINLYKVAFDPNGGEGSMGDMDFIYGTAQILRQNTFTRTYYEFKGWATSHSGPAVYTDGQNVNYLTTENKTVTLYAVWANHYKISYDANGGTGVMVDTGFVYGTAGNLRQNVFVRVDHEFLGWAETSSGAMKYTDEQSVNNLTTEPNGTVTLYAAWKGPVIVSGATLIDKLNWIKVNAVSDTNYVVEVTAPENIEPHNLSYSGKTNITIILKGAGSPYTIGLSTNGSMFTVPTGVTLILDSNITLNGRSENNAPLILINGTGKLVMNNGSIITGNNFSSYTSKGGAVSVGSGTFTMSGGSIVGNSVSHSTNQISAYGGGVYVESGTFIMDSGTISNNTASGYPYGGGVYIGSGKFTMNGGTISGNRSSGSGFNGCDSYGGGVYVVSGTFTMNGGAISSNTASASHGSSTFGTYVSNAYGGGVAVGSGGTFTFNDGTINGNNISTSAGGYNINYSYGGGVSVNGGTFTMKGGTISGNTALYNVPYYGDGAVYGGGVYASKNSSFTKTGGTIYGYIPDNANSNTAKGGYNVVIETESGHAVYAGESLNNKRKETTAGPVSDLSFLNGFATGDWDF